MNGRPKPKPDPRLPSPSRERRRSPAFLILAGISAAFLLLCCVICGGGMWWFRPHLDENAEAAERMLQSMVDIDIADTFQPHGIIEWNIAYLIRLRGVYYERFAGDGVLTLIEINSRLGDSGDVRRQIRDTLLGQGGGGTPLVVDEKLTKVREFRIHGKKVPFTFRVARDPDPQKNRHYRLVEGVFDGKSGSQILFSVRVGEDQWDEASIVNMIKSIGGGSTETDADSASGAQNSTPEPRNAVPSEPTAVE